MSATLDLHTNRDLYIFVTSLSPPEAKRSLEDYLKALWRLGAARRELPALPLPTFAGMLEAALRAPVPPFDPRWPDRYDNDDELAGFARWEAIIHAQIVDLHEMTEAGTLADEWRSFGINAPRGARWYNFDPLGFLECAAEGSFGGWRDGDDTGRGYVPGQVLLADEAGRLVPVDPRELAPPHLELASISWEDF